MLGNGINDIAARQAVDVPITTGNAEAVAAHRVGDMDRGGLIEAVGLAMRL